MSQTDVNSSSLCLLSLLAPVRALPPLPWLSLQGAVPSLARAKPSPLPSCHHAGTLPVTSGEALALGFLPRRMCVLAQSSPGARALCSVTHTISLSVACCTAVITVFKLQTALVHGAGSSWRGRELPARPRAGVCHVEPPGAAGPAASTVHRAPLVQCCRSYSEPGLEIFRLPGRGGVS